MSNIQLTTPLGQAMQFVRLATEAIDYALGNRSAMLSCLQLVTAKYLEDGHDVTPEP